jgi:hypothetical protein
LCLGVALLFGGCGDNNTQGDLGSTPDQSGAADLGMDLSPPSDGMLADGMSGDGSPDALMCTANSFIACAGNTATFCNSTGDGTTDVDCGAPCVAGGCGQCTADACTGGTLTPCDVAHGKTGAPTACVTLKAGGNVSSCNAAGDACAECAGAFVCGSGTTGTANTQYACKGDGTLGTATACAFGCDDANGKCKDLVPASDADAHLAAADTFTCTGTQSATLPAVTAAAGDTLTIDSTTATIQKKNGATVTNYAASWGAAYTPAGSGTPVRVAHIKSLSLVNGAAVKVTGSSGVILLVDGNVTASGALATPTVIDLSADKYTTTGPGADSSNGAGVAAAVTTDAGGGGAGHGSDGAKGGGGNTNSMNGGLGGTAYGATVVLEAGAAGGKGDAAGDTGGHGGGALQISACGNIDLGLYVVVNASGGGGHGGSAALTTLGSGHGGGGGGSGGTILLESATMTITGELASNGAGGGGGAGVSNTGNDGSNWDVTKSVTTAAAGGTSNATGGATGGAGGAGATTPAAGIGGGGNLGGGGGGGAYGRVFLNVSPTATAPTAAAASPTPKASTVCVTVNGAAPASCTYP